MKKSSRFWWLHGAILLSAAIGCKNCGGGNCGGPGSSSTPPYGGTATGSPVVGGSATTYSQSAPGYPGGTAMPGGSSYPPSAGMGYPVPNMSSAMPQGLGGTR